MARNRPKSVSGAISAVLTDLAVDDPVKEALTMPISRNESWQVQPLRRPRRYWHWLATCILLFGCGGGGGSGNSSSVNIAGGWQFTVGLPMQGTVTLSGGTITQIGNNFGSTMMAFPGLPGCATTAAVSDGTITGNLVTFQFQEGNPLPTLVQTLNFSGSINSNASEMSGTFTTTVAGACAQVGDTGTWSAVKM
ncbi:MAG TPA: hypothetical protein VN950_22565 [Terriglobales bacterium]|nr:hypothetical protein [Terriglobales bacterium]